MANFYDEWLGYWDDEQEQRARARRWTHEEELEWVRTKQDYRAALLLSPQIGFFTTGNIMLGEIPRRWHTGKHSHGEEAIYILEGEGFSIVDGRKYDWDKGSCLFMPFGAVHQHFNSGDSTVRYISAMAISLERFVGLAKLIQYEEAGETYIGQVDGVEPAESDIHPEYGRIVLKSKDARVTMGLEQKGSRAEKPDEFHATMAREIRRWKG